MYILLCVFLLLPIVAVGYIGTFSRYWADDYSLASYVGRVGFWRAQQLWYNQWTGRFSYNALASMATFAGPRIVPFLPPIAIIAWFLSLLWMVSQGARMIPCANPFPFAVLLSALILCATLAGIPNMAQSLYWQIGICTKIAPLVLGTFNAGLLIYLFRRGTRGSPSVILIAIIAALTFINGGFSETFALFQIVVNFAALLICDHRRESS